MVTRHNKFHVFTNLPIVWRKRLIYKIMTTLPMQPDDVPVAYAEHHPIRARLRFQAKHKP